MTGGPRRFLRAVRHAPDRLLHLARRRVVLSDLRDGARPRRLLFICHGNICRSPYAAAAARASFPPGAEIPDVASAGFIGPGRPAPPEAVAAAARRGIDLTDHRSRTIDTPSVTGADLVIVMSRGQRGALAAGTGRTKRVIVLGDLDPEPIDTRTIRDPVEQPIDVFEEVYSRIDRCVAALAAALAARP